MRGLVFRAYLALALAAEEVTRHNQQVLSNPDAAFEQGVASGITSGLTSALNPSAPAIAHNRQVLLDATDDTSPTAATEGEALAHNREVMKDT